MKKTFLSSVKIGLTSVVLSSNFAFAAEEAKEVQGDKDKKETVKEVKEVKREKCYGIVKAHKNDCADRKGAHSCAGKAIFNGSSSEWIWLPEGACDKIVDGVASKS